MLFAAIVIVTLGVKMFIVGNSLESLFWGNFIEYPQLVL